MQLLSFSVDDQEFVANWIVFFYAIFCNIVKVNHFLYGFMILHLISSFLLTSLFLVLYAYIPIEPIDCIILSPSELKAILLISSVKTLCCSLLNLCYVFNISLFFLYILYDYF